ncbi:MAG: hypothetical protein ACKVTZ_19580 [Bacteroidia bacterium]
MIPVFQIYKKHAQIPQTSYTPSIRKAFFQWDKTLLSETGYVNGETLYLPLDKKIKANSGHLLVIQDIIGYSSSAFREKTKKLTFPDWFNRHITKSVNEPNPALICFTAGTQTCFFELFSIEKTSEGEFELYLSYENNTLKIGEPKRDDFKLCNLNKNAPIRVCINGKSDFTLTRRQQRIYEEFDYIIEYLGDMKEIEYATSIKIEKEIPQKFEKVIDLRKAFY